MLQNYRPSGTRRKPAKLVLLLVAHLNGDFRCQPAGVVKYADELNGLGSISKGKLRRAINEHYPEEQFRRYRIGGRRGAVGARTRLR